MRWRTLLPWLCLFVSGCQFIPEAVHQPVVHNPFPQLMKVAIVPFINQSTEKEVDGRQFALAYFNELQLVPGFEVVPVGVVEAKMEELHLSLSGAEDARKLARALDVDAIVVGVVTDFNSYYPPRCGMLVEWYAADPGFQPIPAGYGLPWGCPEEEQIPKSLAFEADMAAARARIEAGGELAPEDESCAPVAGAPRLLPKSASDDIAPVMRHVRTYNGHDAEFTAALANYVSFRDDARFGGWQAYLQRSDDFIRFCCHKHIAEMLSARGGAGETKVVWRWRDDR